jgi:hypothetical protein
VLLVGALVIAGLCTLLTVTGMYRSTATERRSARGGMSQRLAAQRHVRGFDEEAYRRPPSPDKGRGTDPGTTAG